MSPVVRRSLLVLALLAAGACSGFATAPSPSSRRTPDAVRPHFDTGDTTMGGGGYTVPHG
jgi:hypothetical protein